jgi:hypothetical protein
MLQLFIMVYILAGMTMTCIAIMVHALYTEPHWPHCTVDARTARTVRES